MSVPIPSESLIGPPAPAPITPSMLAVYCVRHRALYWNLWRKALHEGGFPTVECRRYAELEIERMLMAGELSRDLDYPIIPDDSQALDQSAPTSCPIQPPLPPNPAHAPKKLTLKRPIISPLAPPTIASVTKPKDEVIAPRFSFLKPKIRYAQYAPFEDGGSLAPDYFSPGSLPTHVKVRGGQVIQVRERPACSLWAIAYWATQAFRYERAALEAEWIRVT